MTVPAASRTPSLSEEVNVKLISEGSLRDMQISSTMASKPGSTPGFFNPKRRIGRDFVVLSVANWLASEAERRHILMLQSELSGGGEEKKNESMQGSSGASRNTSRNSNTSSNSMLRPARLLDATCATGIQGLRNAVESPILARSMLSHMNFDVDKSPIEPPELHVVLNDSDENAAELAQKNVDSVQHSHGFQQEGSGSTDKGTHIHLDVTQRVGQSILHEETFEVSVLDPFGSVQPFLDAALARSPKGGLIEVCATDVQVLYGTRPSIAARHYHARISKKRPPCYRERGVRLLLAAIAQAAGRYDRGIVPVYGISTEHFCLVSVKVLRGAKAADATAKQVRPVKICRTCSASSIENHGDGDVSGDSIAEAAPNCGCDPIDGSGVAAQGEGPLWIGPLHDAESVKRMAKIASLEEAEGFISKETRTFLKQFEKEASIDSMFHRRPGVAAKGKIPKLTKVLEELQHRGFMASRTHFCSKSLKTNASATEFDHIVKAILVQEEQN